MKKLKKCRNRIRTTMRINVSIPIRLHDELVEYAENENWSGYITGALGLWVEALKKKVAKR